MKKVMMVMVLFLYGCVAEPVSRDALQQKCPEYSIVLLPGRGTNNSNPYLLKSNVGDIYYVEVIGVNVGPSILVVRHD